MPGVRLHHPALSNCVLVAELEAPYASRKPRACPTCGRAHERKAIHLRLDANGDVIVSREVLESLRTVFLAGMEIVNEIEKPPTQMLGAVEQPKLYVVEQNLNGQKNAAPFYVPGRTKYESRDRLWAALRRALGVKEES